MTNYKLIKEKKAKNEGRPILETEKLYLIPLQVQDLQLALTDYKKMQINLGLSVSSISLDDETTYAMEVRHRKVLADIENYLWLTCWAIVYKEQNQIIGYIIIKGYPNEKGEVIVGYWIDEDCYRRKGHATEALKTLTKWIFENPVAQYVIADTEKTNIASHKVLQKVGAFRYKETEDLIWWKIDRKNLK
jgi:ribosomal-protein-alanine N-acetyltransferase